MAPSSILIIDSDVDSIAIYSIILRHYGYEVANASDVETGLRLAFELKPALVVTELYLPLFAGETLLDHLRRDPRTASTPVILLDSVSAFPVDPVDVTGLTRLTKPCEPSRLLGEVKRILAAVSPATP